MAQQYTRKAVRAGASWPPPGSQETGTVIEMCWQRWRVMEKMCYWRHALGAIAFANSSFFCFLTLKIRLFILFYVWVLCLHMCLRTTYVLGSCRGQGWLWATMWGLWKNKKHSTTELSLHTPDLSSYFILAAIFLSVSWRLCYSSEETHSRGLDYHLPHVFAHVSFPLHTLLSFTHSQYLLHNLSYKASQPLNKLVNLS